MAAKPARGNGGLDGLNGRDGRDSRPVPDPTVRTDQLVNEAVGALRELFEAKLDGQKSVFEARFNGNEQAVRLLQTIMDRQPADVDGKIKNLELLHSERFDSVQTQFKERDTRGTEQTRSGESALKAALDAAKDAVNLQTEASALATAKSEAATTKQMDQLGIQIQTETRALDRTIGDLKERITRIEGLASGSLAAGIEQRAVMGDHRGGNQMTLQLVMGLVTVIAVVFSIVMALRG